jgi:hypothetical protein
MLSSLYLNTGLNGSIGRFCQETRISIREETQGVDNEPNKHWLTIAAVKK